MRSNSPAAIDTGMRMKEVGISKGPLADVTDSVFPSKISCFRGQSYFDVSGSDKWALVSSKSCFLFRRVREGFRSHQWVMQNSHATLVCLSP